jgi:rSAM/selenodomain-associated transferase 2
MLRQYSGAAAKRKVDMRAPLSIVIPTLNAGDVLPDTLASLMEGVEAGLIRELIVSDGGSHDATVAIADAAGAVVVQGVAGRGRQLGLGADNASGDWMLFVHADTHLSPGWSVLVQSKLGDPQTAGYFRLKFRAGGLLPRLFEIGANFRSKLGLPYGDQGLLISRALYDEIGGYPAIPLMEDVVIARALRAKLRALPSAALTSADRYQRRGWIKQGSENIWRLALFRWGVDPAKLAQRYRD